MMCYNFCVISYQFISKIEAYTSFYHLSSWKYFAWVLVLPFKISTVFNKICHQFFLYLKNRWWLVTSNRQIKDLLNIIKIEIKNIYQSIFLRSLALRATSSCTSNDGSAAQQSYWYCYYPFSLSIPFSSLIIFSLLLSSLYSFNTLLFWHQVLIRNTKLLIS